MSDPFTHAEALSLWSRMVAGWANSLDSSGARTLIEGIPNYADAGGSYEGVTRMLWGLGGWLSQPRETRLEWRGQNFDTASLTKQALLAGTNPESLGYWGKAALRGEYDQRTVESGQVAFATWQSREKIWETMTLAEQGKLIRWLETFSQKPTIWRSNWALFWLLNHASRKALGANFDQSLIDSVLEYMDGVYCGNGWYDDGAKRGVNHFDDYNYWVFATHILAWAQCDGDTQPARRDELLGRIQESMEHYPYFFAADGAYTEYGRSLSYKFARLAAPLWAYKQGVWPHSLGMLRRLVGRHIRWYLDRGALRADGTLRQELTVEGSPEVRETYIATGSSYWAMLAFGALWSLPDDDPFWTVAEEPLPAEQDDFSKVFAEPGWVLVGTKQNGQVQRFNARSEGYLSKYNKYLYASVAPFNIGLVDGQASPDNMLCLSDGERFGHRTGNSASSVGEPGWLRMAYDQTLGGGSHSIDTVIIPRGSWHLRAHRVRLDPNTNMPISAVEGSSPLGYVTAAQPASKSDKVAFWEEASLDERSVSILGFRGYDGQKRASSWQGRNDLNSVYANYILPIMTVSQLEPEHELICLVGFMGGAELARVARTIAKAEWLEDGTFVLEFKDEARINVAPLKY
ncbi:MAG: DUF2264 domain-containing protein [Trueperaceae bacterium]|nr:DUF2264 domain-containing protein [Trueperaceae bacterium]